MAGRVNLSAKDMNSQKITNLGAGTAGTDAANKTQVDAAQEFARSRENHLGSQLAATVSDFTNAVRTGSSVSQLAAPASALGMNNQRITSVADPTSAQDAATRAYVDSALAGVSTGLTLKGTVRVATTTNVTVAGPGTTLDGVAMVNGDLVLLTGQSTGSQNGPYVFNGAAVAMTRATNWDTNGEAVLGSFWIVREGTSADKFAILTNDSAITLGTTSLTFAFVGAPSTTGHTSTCPVTAAGATWTVTHNLGTKGVIVQVYRTASPFDEVDVRVERPADTNTVLILPDVALAAGEFTVVVSKAA